MHLFQVTLTFHHMAFLDLRLYFGFIFRFLHDDLLCKLLFTDFDCDVTVNNGIIDTL